MRIRVWSSDVCSSDLDGDERVSRAGQSDEPWRIGLWSDRRWRRDHHRELPGATGASSGTRRTAADASGAARRNDACFAGRSEEHTSELQSLMRISYAVFCLKKKQYN